MLNVDDELVEIVEVSWEKVGIWLSWEFTHLLLLHRIIGFIVEISSMRESLTMNPWLDVERFDAISINYKTQLYTCSERVKT